LRSGSRSSSDWLVAGKAKAAVEDDDRILVDASDVLDSRGQGPNLV
jgi:hypothetical protein